MSDSRRGCSAGRLRRSTETAEWSGTDPPHIPSVTARDNRETILGVEFTVLGGLLTSWGLVASFTPLLLLGVPTVSFGFWVTADTYASGADPRSDTGRTGGAESDPPER